MPAQYPRSPDSSENNPISSSSLNFPDRRMTNHTPTPTTTTTTTATTATKIPGLPPKPQFNQVNPNRTFRTTSTAAAPISSNEEPQSSSSATFPDSSTSKMQARIFVNSRGDTVYFRPSFVEADPWRGLRGSSAGGGEGQRGS